MSPVSAAQEVSSIVIDMEDANPNCDYVPPRAEEGEEQQGELQKRLEDQSKIPADQANSYVYMLVQCQFPEWDIELQEPYMTYISEEMKNNRSKPAGYRALLCKKQHAIDEITRRNPQFKPNKKNNTVAIFLNILKKSLKLHDDRDIAYLKYRERNLRSAIQNYLDRHAKRHNNQLAAANPHTRGQLAAANPHTRRDRMKFVCMLAEHHSIQRMEATQERIAKSMEEMNKKMEEHNSFTQDQNRRDEERNRRNEKRKRDAELEELRDREMNLELKIIELQENGASENMINVVKKRLAHVQELLVSKNDL
eukprot:scaffold13560_cov161-Cylindrotheca_fusiformis.AAC.9